MRVTFGTIASVIGAVLIALGFAWLIAQNWHQIPAMLKILILVLATGGSYTGGAIFRMKNYKGIGNALLILGALLYTLSIFLIAQIFATSTTLQGTAWLLLLSWIGVLISAYIFHVSSNLIIALAEFLIWLIVQFLALVKLNEQTFSPGILAFALLFAGILLYGLSLWHRAKELEFSRVYQWWTAFYLLAFTYLLSSQTLLPIMWPQEAQTPTPAVVFLFFLGIIALFAAVVGGFFALNAREVELRELIGFFCIGAVLSALIGITSFASGEGNGFFDFLFGGRPEISGTVWLIWIVINIAFIGLILALIGYGTWLRLPKIINLAIVFFALDIITRYLGFILDFWGYTSLSIIFITGGIILLGGGWGIEKWRRKLIAHAR